MGLVEISLSMALDGYITGPDPVPDEPRPGPVRVTVFGALIGTRAETITATNELIALTARPETTSLTRLPYRRLKDSLADVGAAGPPPPGPAQLFSKSEFFRRPLPADAVTAPLDTFHADRTAGWHRELTFTPMGGAYNRPAPDATAFVHRDEQFLLEHAAVHDGAAAAPPWVHRSWATVHPEGSGRVYPNFPDPDLTDWAQAYHGGNHTRLASIKRTYDPNRLLDFPHAI